MSAQTESADDTRLRDLLAPYGLSPDVLDSEVTDAFGSPHLVVATGSVVQGFGNARSDVDVYAVVDDVRVSQLPLMSYQENARIEVCLFDAAVLRGHDSAIRAVAWPPRNPGRAAWTQRRRSLDTLTRFALGIEVNADPSWSAWRRDLADGVLGTAVVDWWNAEAVRCRQGARWLRPARPLAAAQRYADAVIAALQARAARQGELYFTAKWLGRKFRRLDDQEGLALLRRALVLPQEPTEVPAHAAWCEEVLAELAVDADVELTLAFAPGTEVIPLGRTALVSRWSLRGLELGRDQVPVADPTGLLWRGPAGSDPGDVLRTLAGNDLLWMGVAARGD